MTNSIENILKRKQFNEPEEFTIIKKFVEERYKITPKLKTVGNSVIIVMPNAAIAGDLQFELHTIQSMIKPRLAIRIG